VAKQKLLMNKQELRKPKDKDFYAGRLVALDTVERFVHGCWKYVITFEDIYTRLAFAWAAKFHAAKTAQKFFALCR
jgi:hypothetical protein